MLGLEERLETNSSAADKVTGGKIRYRERDGPADDLDLGRYDKGKRPYAWTGRAVDQILRLGSNWFMGLWHSSRAFFDTFSLSTCCIRFWNYPLFGDAYYS